MRSSFARSIVPCTLLLTAGTAPAAAQACLGYPSANARFTVMPGITFMENATAFGATLDADLASPLGIDGGVSLIDFDDVDSNGLGIGGRVGYELDVPNASVCPFAGLTYSRVSDEVAGVDITVSGFTVPLGLGAGKTFEAAPGYTLMLFGAPQLLIQRSKISGSAEGQTESESDTDAAFALLLGGTFGTDRVFGSLSLTISTQEGNDTAFALGVGFPIGM